MSCSRRPRIQAPRPDGHSILVRSRGRTSATSAGKVDDVEAIAGEPATASDAAEVMPATGSGPRPQPPTSSVDPGRRWVTLDCPHCPPPLYSAASPAASRARRRVGRPSLVLDPTRPVTLRRRLATSVLG